MNVTPNGSDYSVCDAARTSKEVECTSATPDETEARDRLENRGQRLTATADVCASKVAFVRIVVKS